MNEFFTWTFFLTLSGASLGTSLVTQYLKDWAKDRLKIPPQALSYIIALIILAAAALFTKSASSAGDWAIIPFNALIVAGGSNGAYDAGHKIKEKIEDALEYGPEDYP